ncbi:MAG: sensor domain-containing diguanylate cyclase [candidate division WOR-3 bacterium]|nr:sensor domain-containing diguanylate cyclase [candidate division WOR-3 bacterium]
MPYIVTAAFLLVVVLIIIIIIVVQRMQKKSEILSQIAILTDELDRQKQENISLRNELRSIISQDNLLFSSIIRLTSRLEPIEIAREIVGFLTNYLNAPKVTLFFLDEKEKRLNLVAHQGVNEDWIPKLTYDVGEGRIGVTAEKRIPLSTNESEVLRIKEPYPFYVPDICYPLVYQNRLFGVVGLNRDQHLDEREKNIVGVVTRIASTALQNTLSLAIMRDLASIDPLTKLYNIGYFRDRLTEELNRARRFQRNLSVVIIDLDNFKYFNDTFGHQAGDQLLIRIAQIFNKFFRDTDLVARYGGDEFIVMLPETRKEEAAKMLATLLNNFRMYEFAQGHGERKLAFSAGVATYPDDGITPSDLIKNADKALYEAKSAGRNRVVMYYHKVEKI